MPQAEAIRSVSIVVIDIARFLWRRFDVVVLPSVLDACDDGVAAREGRPASMQLLLDGVIGVKALVVELYVEVGRKVELFQVLIAGCLSHL